MAWEQNPQPSRPNSRQWDTLSHIVMELRLLGRQHEAQGLTAGGCRGGSQVQEAEASRPEGESWHLVSILGIQGIFEKPGGTLGCSVALCSAVWEVPGP